MKSLTVLLFAFLLYSLAFRSYAAVTMSNQAGDYTFQGDMTYYVSNAVTISGTATFEAGAVIKYAVGASLNVSGVVWKGTAYRPVILTAKDDDSVGDRITGSTGNPTTINYYANPALNLSGPPPASWSLANFRIAHAQQAISATSLSITVSLYHGQIVNCQTGVRIPGQGSALIRNLLFANCQTAFNNPAYVTFDVQHTTFGGSVNYPSTPAWVTTGGDSTVHFSFINCIFANLTDFQFNGSATYDGDHNGFYQTPGQFGTSPLGPPASNPFQSKGAANYYLRVASDGSDASGFRDAGTSAIDPTLLVDLSKKTTFPPADPPGPGPLVNWNITAARDTFNPDLGYHYDPLDYWCSQYALNSAPNVINNGVAIGLYGSIGFVMTGGAGINAQGTPDAMVHLVWYPGVQEQPIKVNNFSTANSQLFGINSAGIPKNITLRFADIPMLGSRQLFFDNGQICNFPILALQDCSLRGINLTIGSSLQSSSAGASVTLQNNVCERSTVSLFNGYVNFMGTIFQNPLSVTAYNNLFWNSTVGLTYMESQDQYKPAWTVKDNLLDSAALSFTGDGQYLSHVFRSNNGFHSTTAGQLSGTGDVPVTSLAYTAGPFGPWYIASSTPSLLDVGSRAAKDAGLYHHTVQITEAKELCSQVDIGFHYAAADSSGKAEDSNADGIPDCIQDSNGNGLVDGSEAAWAPSVSVVATDPNASEVNNDTGTFTITRTPENLNVPMTVNFQMSGTAIEGTDYLPIGTQVTIPAGSPSVLVVITPLSDFVAESTESVILTLTGCGENYIVGNPSSDTISITDGPPPPPPVVTIQPADAIACEDTGDPAAFAISRTGGPLLAPITVFFQVDGASTATEGVDYQSLQPHQATIPAGGANFTTVVVQPISDNLPEGSETVVLTLQSGPNYTVGNPSSATVSILDVCSGDTTGTDFWILFFNTAQESPFELRLMISGPSPTAGQVSIPGLGFNQAFSVTPGKVTSVTVPTTALLTDYNIAQMKGIHITADHPVSVYGLNLEPFASEGFLGYPTPFLGTSYCLIARPGNTSSDNRSQFAIVAPQDGTTVTVTPSTTANLDGHPGTGPFTIVLQQGQTYQLRSSGLFANNDVTGTLLSSDKPIAVFAGDRTADVPDGFGASNQLVEEQLPINSWGNQALGFPLASRSNGDVYRILAANDNTEILINGRLQTPTLGGGGFFDRTITEPTEFLGRDATDHSTPRPIQVAQFSTGSRFGGEPGDPFELLLPPAGKYLQAYTVSVPTGFAENFFNLIIDPTALNNTFIDGQQVPPASFQQIGTSSYYGTQWPAPAGPHVISSSKPVGVQVYGFATDDGYGYTGGLSR